MEWTDRPPTVPGRYRAKFMSRGNEDDGVYRITTGTQNRRSILMACWLGKWVNVEDMQRLWLGPLDEDTRPPAGGSGEA